MIRRLARVTAFFIAATIAFFSVIHLNADASTSRNEQTRIAIPALDILAPVVSIYPRNFEDGSSTWDTSSLTMNVGRLVGLPSFGQGGNIVLGGHSELDRGQADIFHELDRLQPGDIVTIEKGHEIFQYQVREVGKVALDDLSILSPSQSEILTLMTCDTSSYDDMDGSYNSRVVVIAERIR